MHVRFRVTGGIAAFPGLTAPRTIDVAALGADVRHALERSIEAAHFFELPGRLPPTPGAADYQSYEITVEDGSRQHTVVVSDPVADPALRALIGQLRELTAHRK
ncbi:MAG: hypothetical protein V7647_3624 [Acidobacteriota bacterium]|jgi:hypothetical protein